MYIAFFVYSLSSVFSKLASKYEMLSLPYIFCFCGIIGILGLYAIIWQQVLKKIHYTVATSSKPFVLVISFLWAFLLFKERITLKFVIGALCILVGIFLVNGKDD